MASIFKRAKKAPVSPEIGGGTLLGAVVISVVAIDLTRAGVGWVGSKVRNMLTSKPDEQVVATVTHAPVSQVAAPEADGNVAEA